LKLRQKIALTARNIMTTQDVAQKLGVTIRCVQLWMDQGLLEGWKTPGGHRRISKESFNDFISSHEMDIKSTENVDSHFKVNDEQRNDAYFYAEIEQLKKEIFRLTERYEYLEKQQSVLAFNNSDKLGLSSRKLNSNYQNQKSDLHYARIIK